MNQAPPLQHKRPLWVAALLAWITGPVVFALYLHASEFIENGNFHASTFNFAMTVILGLGSVISAVAMFLMGLPLALWFRRHGWLAAPLVCLTATGVGALALGLFFWVTDRGPPTFGLWLLGAALGAVSGIVFCVSAGLRWWVRTP